MLRRTDSKRRVDVPRITTQLVYFSSLIFNKRFFFFVIVDIVLDQNKTFGLQEAEAAFADERPNFHFKLGAS
jgi:hypothetical protein